MKNQMKWFQLSLIFLFILILAACSGSETTNEGSSSSGSSSNNNSDTNETTEGDIPEKTFKLAHITPVDHMWHLAAEKFDEELQARTDGKMKLEIYPASQLGTEADMVQQVEAGSIDFGFITAAYLSARTPEMAAWFAPYTFKSLQETYEASKSDIAREILSKIEGTGLKALDYLFAGQRVMILKEKEIKQATDLKGLKMRVTPSPPLQAFYKAAGAAPEALPLPEVYSALQTGVIDGMDMDLDATITNNYSEVAKYAAVTNHMVWPSIIITNESMYNGMSEEARKVIGEALEAALIYSIETRTSQEEEFKSELTNQGMVVYDLGEEVFAEQIEAFDHEYSSQSEVIKEFIETFRK